MPRLEVGRLNRTDTLLTPRRIGRTVVKSNASSAEDAFHQIGSYKKIHRARRQIERGALLSSLSRCSPGAFCPRLPSLVQALSSWLAWIRSGAHMLGLGTLSHRASIRAISDPFLFVPSAAPPLRAATVENLEAFVHSHKRCMMQSWCRHEVELQSAKPSEL
jgi:hypothetical protein